MKLQCVCGKVLNVPDSMAGERIRCKECGKVMTIRPMSDSAPAITPSPTDQLAIQGHRRCSGCGRSWPVRDKICTACGVNLDTGAALYVSLDAASGEVQREGGKKPSTGLIGRLLRFIGMKGH